MSAGSQFDLLRQRRFAPLFWVQFLGAANDNVFKNALVIFAAFHAASLAFISRAAATGRYTPVAIDSSERGRGLASRCRTRLAAPSAPIASCRRGATARP